MDVIRTVSITLLLISFILSLFLILKKNYKYPSQLVGFTLLIYSLFFLSRYLWFDFEIILKYPHILGVFAPFILMPGPLIYILARNLKWDKQKVYRRDYIHFLPAFLHFLDMLPFYLQSDTAKSKIAETIIQEPVTIYYLIHGVISGIMIHHIRLALLLGYLIVSVYYVLTSIIEKERKHISYNINQHLILMVFLFVNILIFNQYLSPLRYFYTGDLFLVVREGIVVSLFAVFFFFLLYSYFDSNLNIRLKRRKTKLTSTSNEVISKEVENNISLEDKFLFMIQNSDLILDPNFSLSKLFVEFNVSPQEIESIVQENYNTSFKNYLVTIRLNYAKNLIEENFLSNQTLTVLAIKSGFKSKMAFVFAFKKEFGLPPLDYHRSIFSR
jgi:AraC-like DNA-binding protein